MRHLLLLALTTASLLLGSTANACEKHLQGHQPGSDTNQEATGK